MSRIISSLGHSFVLARGERFGTNPFFDKVIYVKRGFLVQALLNPGSHTPFMMFMAGPGSLAAMSSAISSVDNLPRKLWAGTSCELLSISPEILLRLADVEPAWGEDLLSYGVRRAVSERIGMMVTQVADFDRRCGVFLWAVYCAGEPSAASKLASSATWLPLLNLPSRKLLMNVISSSRTTVDDVIRRWAADGMIVRKNHQLLVRRSFLHEQWQWIRPFLQMQTSLQNMIQPSRRIESVIQNLDG
ncbi:MAG: hypothetical protein HUK26_02405 [Duodenibacillus sp.]|nr:hypothetical protein [Duodenibacillus sp.]